MKIVKAKLSGLGVGLAIIATFVTGSGAYATSGPAHQTSSDHRGDKDNDRNRHDNRGGHDDNGHDHHCPPIVTIPD